MGPCMSAKKCPDCINAGVKTHRPTPHPAGRCSTHHRAVVAERKRRAHGKRTQTTFGLTEDEYWALWEWQRSEVAKLGGTGVDPIDLKSTGAARRLAVDHDHVTGEVRGLLAGRTNFELLGRFDRDALVRAIEYLADPPARRFFGGPRYVPTEE